MLLNCRCEHDTAYKNLKKSATLQWTLQYNMPGRSPRHTFAPSLRITFNLTEIVLHDSQQHDASDSLSPRKEFPEVAQPQAHCTIPCTDKDPSMIAGYGAFTAFHTRHNLEPRNGLKSTSVLERKGH